MSEGSSVPVVSRWLEPENRTFLELVSMVVTWWIVTCVPSVYACLSERLIPLQLKNYIFSVIFSIIFLLLELEPITF